MARYKMDDDLIVNTEKCLESWCEDDEFDGKNYISINTGSQWNHEKLYKSAKGKYYLEKWSDWQGSRASAVWLSNNEAAAWLILNNHTLPKDLEKNVVTPV